MLCSPSRRLPGSASSPGSATCSRPPSYPSSPPGPDGGRLIAAGLSNTEISDTLVIAEQTTKTHIGRILAKLDLRDRAQAVVFAYETGLVTPGGSGSE
jgi:hypothetical protein